MSITYTHCPFEPQHNKVVGGGGFEGFAHGMVGSHCRVMVKMC